MFPMKSILAVAVTLGLAAQAIAQNAPADRSTGNADNGKKLYTTYYCYACHGTEGQGGRDGARIAPNPPSLATVRSYVRKPSGNMPPYSTRVVTDEELADIWAFLKTIPAPPPVRNIPLLNE
jgi:ubiquinol-cytochrome c reductase cytochrome c subunit